eukprot:gene4768-3429_t
MPSKNEWMNHETHAVQIGRLLGRLWFATKVLSLPCLPLLVEVATKEELVRRLFSQWSRGILSDASPATLSACARQRATHTLAYSGGGREYPAQHFRAIHHLRIRSTFSRMRRSPAGGRSVFIDIRYTPLSLVQPGEPQPTTSTPPSSALSLAPFRPLQPTLSNGARILLRVDNTSALAAFRKGFARSHALNAEVSHYLRTLPYTQSTRPTSPLRRTRQTCRAGRRRTKRNGVN